MANDLPARERSRLALLMALHIVVCCVSLAMVTRSGNLFGFSPPTFHVFYDPARFHIAAAVIAAFALVAPAFAIARFSFGYLAGFYFYTIILGYLWLNVFTDLDYDHRLAGLSAAAAACAFLLPALFISAPVAPTYALSIPNFDRLLRAIVLFSFVIIVVSAFFSFQIVSLDRMYEFRERIAIPPRLVYLLTVASSTLLPFAFAAFVARKAWRWAVACLALLCLFYPITLSKVGLLTPAWLVIMLLLSRLIEARTAAIISVLVPMLAGLIPLLLNAPSQFLFYTINWRLAAIPSVAMDIYNHFFWHHDLTRFCQISFLKMLMHCPYQEQLSLVMEQEYHLGNFNASLFATEGVASVGPFWAPVAAFACGLVFAAGNRLSAGLPAGFVLVSGAIVAQVLLNVSLSTVMVTHGGALLFLLWYLTPRAVFEGVNDRRV
jgi:hypothetical protein